MAYTESDLEIAFIELLEELDYDYMPGPDFTEEERGSYHDVLLLEELRSAIYKINKSVPTDAKEEAIKKIRFLSNPTLMGSNEEFHNYITDGIDVPYRDKDGNNRYTKVFLFSEDIKLNHFICVNQLTKIGKSNRRPDVIIYVNGIPLVVVELKSMSNEDVGIQEAYNQINRYKDEIPELFKYNAFNIISDGINSKVGTISSNFERYMSFRSVDGVNIAPLNQMQMETMAKGMLAKDRLLELVRDYILFMKTKTDSIKILAQYHQYFAVKKALEKTAESKKKSGRIGVIWHTQGSGKSLTMTFYAGQLMKKFNNPTIVVVTDRNDLDDQLFGTYSKCSKYLVENPKQADDREQLRDYLNVQSGGIIFTTIQKFSPEKDKETIDIISNRDDIIVIADEAHRSQYGLDAVQDTEGNIKYGYAKHLRDALPKANFIGFTGTPIDFEDKSTTGVFGDCIDVYDMTRAVEDGATVKIFYENRFIKLDFLESALKTADKEVEVLVEKLPEYNAVKKVREFSNMEAVIGHPARIKKLASDMVEHWEKRKSQAFGKSMAVCMSRKVCVDLYNQIIDLRPDWHSEDKNKGKLKVIMTNSASDPEEWKDHFTTKQDREDLANRMRDETDELEFVIVRDMWLTGFDVPCMHTMYIDKSMKGHNLMQAIARVNRVFKDKDGGLVVDYIGIAEDLKDALKVYSDSDKTTTGIDIERAKDVMLEHYEVVKDMLHGFDYSGFSSPKQLDRARAIMGGMDFVYQKDLIENNFKKDFIKEVITLSKAHALCISTDIGTSLIDEISYFKAVKATLVKQDTPDEKNFLSDKEINERLAKLLSKSVISEEVIDIYKELGIDNPNLSILSDEFLEEIKAMQHKNLAVEMLKKLLEGKIKVSSKINLVMSEKFSDKLKKSMQQYRNRAITSIEVMDELIKMAKEFQEMQDSNNELGLNDDEVAFYDALATDDIKAELEDCDVLKTIAIELTRSIKANLKVDWYEKESAQAAMRKAIKRLLKKYKYPPKGHERAVETVLRQAKLMCEEGQVVYS
ncbi:MAG: type I restriction endonuclease subunit R [Spirochaetales bacterium]|nr:type I restriction endonuclease subunit R [Spirochaetales bacterium]